MLRMIIAGFCLLTFVPGYAAIVLGNPKGHITVVEVLDYQCPHCHEAYPAVEKLVAHNTDVRLRLLPTAIINATSIYEAAAAIAVTRYKGQFQLFNSVVLSEPPLNKNQVKETLNRLGLATKEKELNELMHRTFVKKQILEGLHLLKKYQANTPFFMIYPTGKRNQAKILRGVPSYRQLQKGVDNVANRY